MKRYLLRVSVAIGLLLPIAYSANAQTGELGDPKGETTELSETTELEDPLGVTARRLAESLGISAALAREYLEREERVHELYSALRTSGPKEFDDMYIEYEPAYRLIVHSTASGPEAIESFVRDNGFSDLSNLIEVQEVSYTTQDLEAALREMNVARPGVDFVAQEDIKTSTVRFSTATEEDADRLREALDSISSLPISRIEIVAEGLIDTLANSFGGLNLDRQNGDPECTSGFSVEQTDSGTADGVATAGHCHNTLQFTSGDDIDLQAAIFADSQDTQWHKTPNYNDQPWVRDGGTSHRTVTNRRARADMMIDDYVCLSKRNDSVNCGFIEAKSFDLGSGFNATFIRVDSGPTLAVGGDSGGPFWLGITYAYGTLVGAPDDDLTDAVFMAQNYMGAINVRVKTG